jgi:hypothetical protein
MGFMKNLMIEAQERGWWPIEGYVCDRCVGEAFLAQYVRDNAVAKRCDFCDSSSRSPIASDADNVMDLIGAGLHAEWSHPVQMMGRVDGEWVGDTFELDDVLSDSGLEPSDAFRERIADAFTDELWCEADPYGLPPHQVLGYGWERFAEHVKYHTRYVFLLEEPSEFESHDEIHPGQMLYRLREVVAESGIVHSLSKGTRFVRGRDHDESERPQSGRELGTPSPEKARKSNRMSPAGIPLFYGAADSATAVAEMSHSARPLVTLAEFVTTRDLRVVDLSRIPEVPSLFNETQAYRRPSLLFLHDFAEAISQPIVDDDREHIDYVPTQVVTDYLRRVFRDADGSPIDGLLYRSSRHEGGECCVLFVSNEECGDFGEQAGKEVLLLDRSTRRTERLHETVRRSTGW